MTTTTIAAIASSIAVFILFAGGFIYYRRRQNNKNNYVHPDIENDIVLRKKPMPSSTTISSDDEHKGESSMIKVPDQVPIKGQLTIKVIKGVEIKYRSIFGTADPYVSLQIGDDIKKTSVCSSGGMNPQWNEDVIFNIRNEDSIDIEVLDKQITGDDRSMGKCSVSISDWILHGYSGELELINSKGKQSTKGPSKDGLLIIDAVFKPHVQRLRPISIKRKPSIKMPNKQKAPAIEPQLVITVIRGIAIRSGKSLFGQADPYCTFNIGDEDRRTKVCPGGGMNPEWNEDISFQNIGNESTLNIYLYDKDTAGIDRYMGECKVDIADWISNGGFDGELQIINRRGKDEGILIVSAKYKVPTLLII